MTPARRARDRRCRYPTDAAAREGTLRLNAAQRRRWWKRNSKRLALERWRKRLHRLMAAVAHARQGP